MRKLRFLSLCISAVLITALLSGCISVSRGGSNMSVGTVVQGRGEMVSFTVDTEDFSSVSIDGIYAVIYRHSGTASLRVEIQENLFEYMRISAEGGTLRISSEAAFNTSNENRPRLYIYAPELESVSLGGAVHAGNWDNISRERLVINLSGASQANIEVDVEELYINISGASNNTFSGRAGRADIRASGAVNISAEQLLTRDAAVNISGVGIVTIACSETLNAVISGSGSLRYIGSPHVISNISGVGTIRQINP